MVTPTPKSLKEASSHSMITAPSQHRLSQQTPPPPLSSAHPWLVKERLWKIIKVVGLYIWCLTPTLHPTFTWAGHSPVTKWDWWHWSLASRKGLKVSRTFPKLQGVSFSQGLCLALHKPPSPFHCHVFLMGALLFRFLCFLGCQATSLPNLNSLRAKAQHTISFKCLYPMSLY